MSQKGEGHINRQIAGNSEGSRGEPGQGDCKTSSSGQAERLIRPSRLNGQGRPRRIYSSKSGPSRLDGHWPSDIAFDKPLPPMRFTVQLQDHPMVSRKAHLTQAEKDMRGVKSANQIWLDTWGRRGA